MFLAAIGTSIYVLLASVEQQQSFRQKQPISLQIRPAELPPGEFQRIPWQGGNLILLHHSEALHTALENHRQELHDPRPLSGPAEFYVAFDRGTGLGCPLQWVAPANNAADAPLQPWPGGLRDSCDGSWYDAAGRVFKGQAATRNLDAPAYRLEGELLIVGTNGDNPVPAK